MGEAWTVNSDHTEASFIGHVKRLRAEHGYLTFPAPRVGEERSLSQNALLHAWAREYAAYLLKKTGEDVTKGELAGMKRTIKLRYNADHPNNFIIHEIVDPFTKNTKQDVTSSGDWKTGELYMVMEWVQLTAANDGLILESKGQYEKLKRKSQQ